MKKLSLKSLQIVVSVHSVLPLTFPERRKIGMGCARKSNLFIIPAEYVLSDGEGRRKTWLALIETISLF